MKKVLGISFALFALIFVGCSKSGAGQQLNLVMATGVTKKIASGYIKYGKEPDRDYHTARR